MQTDLFGRRGFIKAGWAGLAMIIAGPRLVFSTLSSNQPMAPRDFKAQLAGPMLSIPTTYTSDFKIDYQGMTVTFDRGPTASQSRECLLEDLSGNGP